MRLWLDDLRPMPNDYDVHVRTVEHAKAVIETGLVKHISFDHDLGGEKDPFGPGEQSGYSLACWIEDGAHTDAVPPMTWTVHSMNPVGVENIKRAMNVANNAWRLWGRLP